MNMKTSLKKTHSEMMMGNQNARKRKPHFLIDLSYQPINRMWGAKIKHGNIAIFEIDENPTIAVSKAVKKILEYEKC